MHCRTLPNPLTEPSTMTHYLPNSVLATAVSWLLLARHVPLRMNQVTQPWKQRPHCVPISTVFWRLSYLKGQEPYYIPELHFFAGREIRILRYRSIDTGPRIWTHILSLCSGNITTWALVQDTQLSFWLLKCRWDAISFKFRLHLENLTYVWTQGELTDWYLALVSKPHQQNCRLSPVTRVIPNKTSISRLHL